MTLTEIPTPTKGQPIDASFLYSITKAINDIIRAVDLRKGMSFIKSGTTDAKIAGRSTAGTSFDAFTVKVDPPTTEVTSGTTQSLKVEFKGATFSETPVITVTPVIIGTATAATKSTTVVLSEITKGGFVANVNWTTAGPVKDLYLQVIAIGYQA
jgi:hypothetical protein